MLNSQRSFVFALLVLLIVACEHRASLIDIREGSSLVLVGNNLGARMMHYGHFDTELHLRYPDTRLFIRNMCDAGNTPGFRPHAARPSPWAFPGAEKFQTELANYSDSQGQFETEDQWLQRLRADVVLGFFGYNESFAGKAGLENFKAELTAFVNHTLKQQYNGVSAPQLVLVSPIAFEDLSSVQDLPDGKEINENLALYTDAIREVSSNLKIPFIDIYNPSIKWYTSEKEALTIDGFQLNDNGYKILCEFLVNELTGTAAKNGEQFREAIKNAVIEKDWMWHNDFKIPNGVHVYGRRYKPFGPDNYPAEIEKIRQMTAIRDTATWLAAKGESMDVAAADARTRLLPTVETNFKTDDEEGTGRYLYGDEALKTFTVAKGYQIELFASEKEFTDLANPAQIAFDNKGRLWIATMPTYPHYKPGDPKPNDKLIILEDTDRDGKADKQTIFADNLHLPLGFEFAPEGVYVSQGTNLILLTDTNGDDRADKKEIVLSGFDDHDSHHGISAFCADPSGAIYMAEGVFLHTNVETAYGPVRATNGGFYRYDVNRRHLQRIAQLAIPNPWGIAFDKWGQDFYTETSSPDIRWMMPGSIKPIYGVSTHKSFDLVEQAHRVRPTSGLEFVSSRHFPDEAQGDMLVNNTIGFLGTKQHAISDDGTGFKLTHRQDLVRSSDGNFRPVDLEFAPDGSLYICDWHNLLIGHMQHNARDPLRDHVHGRIYRITYPSRPLVEPARIDGASIDELLNNLKLPEYRTRYRTRRELREHSPSEVLSRLKQWVDNLDETEANFEHHALEALWVSAGINNVDLSLLEKLLAARDYHVRAAAVRVLRHNTHKVQDHAEKLKKAAEDSHSRVGLEAIVASSWISKQDGLDILEVAGRKPLDPWMAPAYETALAHLNGKSRQEQINEEVLTKLKGQDKELYIKGKEIYSREGFCMTCHQSDGGGLSASSFPPIRETPWVTGNEERLMKVVLNGLHGPMKVNGNNYNGAMTPFGALLNDEEIAAVLTYVRNSFGNTAPPVSPQKVKMVRDQTKGKTGFYSPEELLEQHPLEK